MKNLRVVPLDLTGLMLGIYTQETFACRANFLLHRPSVPVRLA
jgi:hypothetical protein